MVGVGYGCGDLAALNAGRAVVGWGNAVSEGGHIGGWVSDALVWGLAFKVVSTAVGGGPVAVECNGDVTVLIERKECVNSLPGFGDVMGAADEVMEAVGGGCWAGFDGEECFIAVKIVEDGETVGFVGVCAFDSMLEDVWVNVHDGDGGCVGVEVVLGLDEVEDFLVG